MLCDGHGPEAAQGALWQPSHILGRRCGHTKTLPFGTKEQVRDEVLRRCEIFSKDGGFVFNAIHNIQAKTPVENIVAMLDAVHEFNGGK